MVSTVSSTLEESNLFLERGMVHHEAGRLREAELDYKAVLALVPEHDIALHQLGLLAYQVGNFALAVNLIRRANTRAPQHAHYWSNLALAYAAQGLLRDAVESCKKAIELKPDFVEVFNNLGLILTEGRMYREAETSLRRAIKLRPDAPEARANLGFLLLLQGRFKEGWDEYEYRPANLEVNTPPALRSVKRWHGEPFSTRRILLVGEAGIGDQIQMVRFAQSLHAKGATVDLLVHPQLVDLFAIVRGVRHVFSTIPQPAANFFDLWVPMLSVPKLLGTDVADLPANVPYLQPNAVALQRWARKLANLSSDRLRVGLVWADDLSGRVHSPRDLHFRSLEPLKTLTAVQFISLQTGEAAAQMEASSWKLPAIGSSLRSLGDTAAVIAHLDMVVTADCAVAHLAGAMGKPAWILLPANPDWRWQLGRSDSPWYPTARLFRQRELEQWDPVIDMVHRALISMAARKVA